MQRELHVAAAFDAERADDPQRRAAEHLVFLVGQGLRRRDDDGVAGVDAHRVDVFHVADGDARIAAVAHDLVLDLLPAEERSLDEDLADRRRGDAARDALAQRDFVMGHAPARATERERGTDDERVTDLAGERDRVVDRRDRPRLRDRLADRKEKLLERLAVLGVLDRGERRAEKPHAVALEHPGLGERDSEVEAGLAPERREETAGPLLRDDPLEHLDRERLEVRDVGDAGVGHDRRRVRVHEDGLDALLAQGAAGLRPGVVEFRSLPDEDRSGADDQDFHRSNQPPPTGMTLPPTWTAVIRSAEPSMRA